MNSSKSRTSRHLIFVSLFCMLLLLLSSYWKRKSKSVRDDVIEQERTSTSLQVDIGSRKNLREGEIAAIQELSRRLDTEPQIDKFKIVFHSPKRYFVEYDKSVPYIQCHQQTIVVTKYRSRWSSLFDHETWAVHSGFSLYLSTAEGLRFTPEQIHAAARKKMSVSDLVKIN